MTDQPPDPDPSAPTDAPDPASPPDVQAPPAAPGGSEQLPAPPPGPEQAAPAPPPPPPPPHAPPSSVQAYAPPPPPPGQYPTAPSGASTDRKNPEERKQILAQQLQMTSARGRRIESQQEFQAVLIEGKPVNHTLHAILTVFTCLLWGIVWIIIAATGGEKRELIAVDEWGNVQYQRLGKA